METASASISEYGDEEDYIDMELSSSPSASTITNSSPQSREFEFQRSAAAASPADHLFHKGKLLPLYLLPSTAAGNSYYSLPFTAATPLDSSPSESCRASCELHPDDFFFEWSNDFNTFINQNHPTKISWHKKLNHSILAHKLRASKAYLKSLFVKSAKPNSAAPPPLIPKPHEISDKRKPTIAAIINNVDKDGDDDTAHRRSFSSAIKRHSPTKCMSSSSSNSSSGSSSFSLNSNGLHGRSSSATETEGSIQAAIAHCKKSHQTF